MILASHDTSLVNIEAVAIKWIGLMIGGCVIDRGVRGKGVEEGWAGEGGFERGGWCPMTPGGCFPSQSLYTCIMLHREWWHPMKFAPHNLWQLICTRFYDGLDFLSFTKWFTAVGIYTDGFISDSISNSK